LASFAGRTALPTTDAAGKRFCPCLFGCGERALDMDWLQPLAEIKAKERVRVASRAGYSGGRESRISQSWAHGRMSVVKSGLDLLSMLYSIQKYLAMMPNEYRGADVTPLAAPNP